ncbi:hypothetical protein O7626_40265 [Micromonospora sp. WMMD1102]|uniref:hypothetical protein n=1 Tax=Micromonospora sp. WMMD1102 TaxID=3016105 RepID=UPI0024150EBC|nr:hypothetical protein [Micromonospora sp. WMMD1102]MDG4792053.1 hypothetical protein [Micromonospora sp. WMMD1102]
MVDRIPRSPSTLYALAVAVRREVFRDHGGVIWQHHGTDVREAGSDVVAELTSLEEAGLVTCPPPAGRHDRYFEVTDKALEA